MNNDKLKSVLIIGFTSLAVLYWGIMRYNDDKKPLQLQEDIIRSNGDGKSTLTKPRIINPLADLHEGIESHRQKREQETERIQLEREAEEKERLRLEHWKAKFPYKKTYHPTLTYDPNRYNPKDPTTFSGDPEMEMAVKNHGFLVAFYNNPQIYSAEFEQLYHLLEELDRSDNTKIIGEIFNILIHFHKIKHYYDPEDLWAQKRDLPLANQSGTDKKTEEVWVPINGRTTWGDRAERFRASIVGLLVMAKYWPDKEPLDPDVARAFRDRLIDEIPSENLIEMQDVVVLPDGEIGAFGYYQAAEEALKPGDKLLYR